MRQDRTIDAFDRAVLIGHEQVQMLRGIGVTPNRRNLLRSSAAATAVSGRMANHSCQPGPLSQKLAHRAFAALLRTSLQPGPPRVIRRTESNYQRGHNGATSLGQYSSRSLFPE